MAGQYGKLKVDREVQPYFVYQRINLTAPMCYWLFPIDYGFYYLLRKISIQYPEISALGVYGPHLRFELYQRAQNLLQQVVPIPDDLFSTPGPNGVSVVGGDMTATAPRAAKLQNIVYPFRDNLEVRIHGWNGTNPVYCDICMMGYLVPAGSLTMWEGSGNG